MSARIVGALSAMLLGSMAIAQEDCVSIEDDTDRLNCFDAVFVGTAPDEQQAVVETETEDPGKWQKRVDVSVLTDDKNVFLSLASENEIAGRYNSPGNGTLLLRCMENTTSAIFSFNENFMSDIQGYGQVEYRIDDNALAEISTNTSTDNMALGLWNGGSSIPFIKKLLAGDQLIIRATPYSESPMTLTYDVRGLEVAIGELRESCGW